MKTCWLAIICVISNYALAQAQDNKTVPEVSALTITEGEVTTLHLCAGYTTSLRLPEEVSSVVVGNPAKFKAEHATSEPRLVFLKPLTSQKEESNALVTTKSGQEINLHLISECNSTSGSPVDFFVEYTRPRSTLIRPSDLPSFTVAGASPTVSQEAANKPLSLSDQVMNSEVKIAAPAWQGDALLVSIGQTVESEENMIVGFSILNKSERAIEVLPPQIQLRGNGKKKKQIKADPLAISNYRLTSQRLEPGERADGIVVFERPKFKETRERLEIAIAEADAVDHPMVLRLPFTPDKGDGK